MRRWPMDVGWTQITISTVTAGFGFGLVIAPISTTTINAVRANQAGMGAAVVTALRMVGMMLGLAALTSWGLAYFKHLVSLFPSLSATATAEQFAKWSQDYGNYLLTAAHSFYSAIFFVTMILCLVAIIPAIFLWGRKAPVEERDVSKATTGPLAAIAPGAGSALHEDDTVAVTAPVAGTFLATAAALDELQLAAPPPVPPAPDDDRNGGNGGRRSPQQPPPLDPHFRFLLRPAVIVCGRI